VDELQKILAPLKKVLVAPLIFGIILIRVQHWLVRHLTLGVFVKWKQ